MNRAVYVLIRQLIGALATLVTSQQWQCECQCVDEWSCPRCVAREALEAARAAGHYKGPAL